MNMDDILSNVATGLEDTVSREKERRRAKEDLMYLGRNVLGYTDLSDCHQELCDWLDEHWEDQWKERQFFLFLLPRGHFKSSLVTIGKSVQEILKKPDIRILITNAVWENARKFLGEMKGHFSDEWFEKTFNLTLTRETVDEIVVSTRQKSLAAPTVTTSGIEKTQTSQHYDLIILDDLVVRENIGTKEQRDKPVKYYKDALDLLEPGGKLIVIGTRWHQSDLYGQILDPTENIGSNFKTYKRAALVTGKIRAKELDDGSRIAYATDDSVPLFPERFTLNTLCQLYHDKGQFEYYAQYHNETVDDEHATFKKSWIKEYDPKDIAGMDLNYTIVLDPALSVEKYGDYSAWSIVGVAPDGRWYARSERLKTDDPTKIIEFCFELNRRYNPLSFGVEAIQYQQALAEFIKKRSIETNEFIPIVELKPDVREKKEMRIKSLQPYFEFGRILLEKGEDDLMDELFNFPRSKHDDLMDALAYQVQLATFAPTVRVTKKVNPNSFDEVVKWNKGLRKDRSVMGNEHAEERLSSYDY